MRERVGRWRFARGLKACAAAGDEVLTRYASAAWPSPDIPAREAPLLALDFELDGLERNAHVLQAGWIGFDSGGIALAGARSVDVRSLRQLDDSAVAVHGIGEERARQGVALQEAARSFLGDLAGRILVAHGASIERDVIRRISRAMFGIEAPVRSICTLQLERRISPNLVGSDAYRLAAARKRHNLPGYAQHDALSDALAAAELFLAQLSRLPADVRLGSLESW